MVFKTIFKGEGMQKMKMLSGFLALAMSTQVYSQALESFSNTQTRINANGETYVVESSDSRASNIPSGMEKFAVLETGSKGEAKADVSKVILERSFDTPNRVRVKLKTPLFKYKPIMSGSDFYVETSKEVVDQYTGQVIRVKDYQKKRLVWCGLEPCLLSTAFLLKVCEQNSSSCTAAYDTIIVDFSKAKSLEMGETEQFFISAYQRKIPGKAIDFFVYPIPGRILAKRYIVEHKKKLFGPDVYVVREMTKKEIDAENQTQVKVSSKDVLDLEAAQEFNSITRYETLPTNLGLPGQSINPAGRNSSESSSTSGVAVEELCLDELGNLKSSRTIIESDVRSSKPVITNSNRTEITRVKTLESSEDAKRIEKGVNSFECSARKAHLVLQESLAGQKGALKRDEYLKKYMPRVN